MTEQLFKWPLIVIDFEASALATEAYPIEVGIAVADKPTTEPFVWSTLIKPDSSWNIDQQWDSDAERIHCIKRWDLRDGFSPREVMIELNRRIPKGATVWCDGGHYDEAWLKALCLASNVIPNFEMHDLTLVWQREAHTRDAYLQMLATTRPVHRAGPDSQRILKTLCLLYLSSQPPSPHAESRALPASGDGHLA